ncbi:hypothetical protein MTP99_011477 [Tenebrio molitor]|jgi:hypothetical protein|nr:hypothetical protein MTP99_011477 [Tenebrio molitor]
MICLMRVQNRGERGQSNKTYGVPLLFLISPKLVLSPVGRAARKYFDFGSEGNCQHEKIPKNIARLVVRTLLMILIGLEDTLENSSVGRGAR